MKRALVPIFTALLLAAGCGDSGSASSGNNPPSAAMAITSANALNTTQVSYEAALLSGDFTDIVGDAGLTASAPGGFSKTNGRIAVANKLTSYLSMVPFGPITSSCAVSGSVTLSGNLADPTTLTAGDDFAIDFDNCNDGLGEVINGALDFTVSSFSGDFLGGLYDLTMAAELTAFQVTVGNDVITSSGDTTVTLNTIDAPFVSASLSGNSMRTDLNSSSEVLTNFMSAQTFDGRVSPAPYTLTASGTLDSTQLPGSVQYSTPVTFIGFDTDYPTSGEFLVTGDNSSARLIALDNVNVRIEIDTNGDGAVDETINTTWAELSS